MMMAKTDKIREKSGLKAGRSSVNTVTWIPISELKESGVYLAYYPAHEDSEGSHYEALIDRVCLSPDDPDTLTTIYGQTVTHFMNIADLGVPE